MIFDPEMLGRPSWFAGPSWYNWRVVLKAMFAEEMSPREVYRFWELADRAPPKHRVREAWLAIGRRAGKDSIASGIAAYIAAMHELRTAKAAKRLGRLRLVSGVGAQEHRSARVRELCRKSWSKFRISHSADAGIDFVWASLNSH
jgi:hypothetical protein